MNPITFCRAWIADTFTVATATSPLPPHVASLRLNMSLMHLHMEQAQHGADPRTKVGYILATNKEYKS